MDNGSPELQSIARLVPFLQSEFATLGKRGKIHIFPNGNNKAIVAASESDPQELYQFCSAALNNNRPSFHSPALYLAGIVIVRLKYSTELYADIDGIDTVNMEKVHATICDGSVANLFPFVHYIIPKAVSVDNVSNIDNITLIDASIVSERDAIRNVIRMVVNLMQQ